MAMLDGSQFDPDDRDDRRKAILRTAIKLWGCVGYHAVSLRRIADEAAVAPSLIDHHFGTKINLFAQAIRGFSVSCNEARRELQPTYDMGISEGLTTERVAAGLFRPIELLSAQGESGQDTLRLCATHWLDPTPDLHLHLDRAFSCLRIVVVDMLSTVMPRASLSSLQTTSQLGFLGALAIVIESKSQFGNASTPDAGEAERSSIESAKRFIVAAIHSTQAPSANARRTEKITGR